MHMLKNVVETIQSWRRRQDCIRELSQLTDRELADIGIHRSDIGAIARSTAAH